jgi:hypothetical protein
LKNKFTFHFYGVGEKQCFFSWVNILPLKHILKENSTLYWITIWINAILKEFWHKLQHKCLALRKIRGSRFHQKFAKILKI